MLFYKRKVLWSRQHSHQGVRPQRWRQNPPALDKSWEAERMAGTSSNAHLRQREINHLSVRWGTLPYLSVAAKEGWAAGVESRV